MNARALRFCLASVAAAWTLPASGADKTIIPWSFKALKRPPLPQVGQTDWPREDLDRFVLAGLAAARLSPNPDAPRAVLIRRATIDLHGLLPGPEEVAAFENDPRPDDQAFGDVIDRLLKSPRFGERWARHWLDLARYADSVGRSWNAPFTHAFRYRDWVVDSFNADKPYTRFVAEQIAGDLLPARNDAERQQNIIGTGFLALGCLDLTALQYQQFLLDRIDDQIDATTRAFLGLTIACARCHDHKTDPVTQHDYYALAGLFNSTETWSGTAHKAELGPNLYVDPERLLALPATRTLLAAPASKTVPPAVQPGEINVFDDSTTMSPATQGMVQRDGKGRTISYEYDPRLAMGVSEGAIDNCPIRIAGDPFDEGKTPKRGDLEIPGLPPLPKVGPRESGRLQFAQWICQPTHPLTARVMVNRIWAHLFRKGIVSTVDNFGITGEKPLQPDLLDHLAVRFVEGGWSVKTMIRSMMLSRTYRQDSGLNSSAHEIDPSNERYWRMNPRRMEMEVLRDSLLQLAGDLSFARPDGIQIAGNGGKGNTGRTRSLLDIDAPFRTIYLPVLRDLLPEMHETWDFPNPTQIKGQREVTTVPSQGLFMMNSRLVADAARALALRLLEDTRLADDPARLQQAYRTILSRTPDVDETKAAMDMMRSLETAADEKDPELYRWAAMIQALMASSEFRYVL